MVGDHVTIDAGTGCVHTAPGHGEEDFYVSENMELMHYVQSDDVGVIQMKHLDLKDYSTMMQTKQFQKR